MLHTNTESWKIHLPWQNWWKLDFQTINLQKGSTFKQDINTTLEDLKPTWPLLPTNTMARNVLTWSTKTFTQNQPASQDLVSYKLQWAFSVKNKHCGNHGLQLKCVYHVCYAGCLRVKKSLDLDLKNLRLFTGYDILNLDLKNTWTTLLESDWYYDILELDMKSI